MRGSLRLSLVACLLLLQGSGIAWTTQPNSPKKVLILNSFTERVAFDSTESVKAAVRSQVPEPVDFYVEFIEGFRLGEEGYEKTVVESFREAFSGQKLDLIIVGAYPALEFAVRHREELFSDAPVVFAEVSRDRLPAKIWPGVTGVTLTVDIGATVDLALRLHPKTTTVAIITNTSPFEKYWLGAVHRDLARRPRQLAVVDLVGIPPRQLAEKIDALPHDSIALFQEAPEETVQPVIGPYEALASVGERVPTYSIFPVICLGRGCIGGASWDNQEQTDVAAHMASRVLSGERPDDIPIVNGRIDQVRVDWQQLQHWHIPESALPPGSIVVNRQPTFWDRERGYIIAALVLILAQSLLIAALLWQRARKRKAESVLRESEKRFRVMADTTPSLIWMCDADGKITYLNGRRAEFTGPDPHAGYGDSWKQYIHPADLENVSLVLDQALRTPAPFSNEYRLRRYDGEYRCMFDVVTPRVNGDGSFAGLIGSAVDITDQKMAQDALENVSGRLIEAQERERTRIARDLHDDICQRLALLSMELEQANRTLNGSSNDTRERLEEIQQHCAGIAGDVQALSHQLHSSKLDYLGISAAIRGFCKEFAKQYTVSVDFVEENIPIHLPKDASLCLFRVAQEGLHNAVKHSGATQFVVTLRKTAEKVELEVRDYGVGFDVEEAKRNRGLGLLSMQERVHLVHGTFAVESAPGKGTRLLAEVPAPEEDGAQEAGNQSRAANMGGAA